MDDCMEIVYAGSLVHFDQRDQSTYDHADVASVNPVDVYGRGFIRGPAGSLSSTHV